MKILILGGTGAMGVDLVKILGERGKDVTVTSRLERRSEFNSVKYVKGDAHDTAFLTSLLTERYDAIVDFMVYNTDEFNARRGMLLGAANQYLFLSSSRVYANSKTPITEDSPRLLDATIDKEYLQTDEYALTKARQENLLHESGMTNWTIIRPYITYSNQRLQLGVYEKELWLYRALHNQTVVFPTAIAEKYTTMTLGEDVAWGIAALIGNEKAMGEAFHIATDKAIKWDEVLMVYKKVFKNVVGREIKVRYTDDPKPIYEAVGNKYQVVYDRLFDRRFDNRKFRGVAGELDFIAPEVGLEQCLREFLKEPKLREISLKAQAWMDREMKEHTPLSQFGGFKKRVKYAIGRYTPYFEIKLKGNCR